MSFQCCTLDARGGSLREAGGALAQAVLSGAVGVGGANRTVDVTTVQILLNLACVAIGVPKKTIAVDGWIGPITVGAIREFQTSRLGFADGRVDPGQRTIGQLNSLASGAPSGGGSGSGSGGTLASSGSSFAPPVGPAKALALAALPTATRWALGALTHSVALLMLATPAALVGPPFSIINVHFHLERDPVRLVFNLIKIRDVFVRMLQTLGNAMAIFRDGPAVSGSPFADAPMGGFNFPGTQFFAITFRPGYVACGPMCRAAMIVHEGAHFVGGVNEISHFAMEFPAPNGQPQGKGNTRNYQQLRTDEALRNASSYAAFAIHASTGIDSRFGASDLTK